MDFTNPSIFAFGVSIVYLMNKVEQLEKQMTKPDEAVEVNETNLLKMENERLKKELEEKEAERLEASVIGDVLYEENARLKETNSKMKDVLDECTTSLCNEHKKEVDELKTKLENLENEYAEHVTKTFEAFAKEQEKVNALKDVVLDYEKKTKAQIERATKLEENLKKVRESMNVLRQNANDAWTKAEADSDAAYTLRNNDRMGINYNHNTALTHQKCKDVRQHIWNMFLRSSS